MSVTLILLLALFSGGSVQQPRHEINVAAAADLSNALQEIAANYEKRTGVTVKLSFGASGALTQQIQNGAPFDVFFSADMDYPQQLIAGGRPRARPCIAMPWGDWCCGFRKIRRSMSSTKEWMCCSIPP